MVVSAALLPLNVCVMAFTINFIAIYYHASRAIPFGTMVGLLPHNFVVNGSNLGWGKVNSSSILC